MILVHDTKHPNKDPFEISEAGFNGLKTASGGRYVAITKPIITESDLRVKYNKVAPVKTTAHGKPQA